MCVLFVLFDQYFRFYLFVVFFMHVRIMCVVSVVVCLIDRFSVCLVVFFLVLFQFLLCSQYVVRRFVSSYVCLRFVVMVVLISFVLVYMSILCLLWLFFLLCVCFSSSSQSSFFIFSCVACFVFVVLIILLSIVFCMCSFYQYSSYSVYYDCFYVFCFWFVLLLLLSYMCLESIVIYCILFIDTVYYMSFYEATHLSGNHLFRQPPMLRHYFSQAEPVQARPDCQHHDPVEPSHLTIIRKFIHCFIHTYNKLPPDNVVAGSMCVKECFVCQRCRLSCNVYCRLCVFCFHASLNKPPRVNFEWMCAFRFCFNGPHLDQKELQKSSYTQLFFLMNSLGSCMGTCVNACLAWVIACWPD